MKTQQLIWAIIVLPCFLINSKIAAQSTWEPEIGEARIIPYKHVREADVMLSKRVWRKIDLREKMNHPLYFPIDPIEDRKSLFDVIKEGLLTEGSLTAYNPGALGDNDEFTVPMAINEIERLLKPTDTVWVEGLDDDMVQVVVENFIESKDIRQYELKEEWFFNSKYSTLEVRIVGICPYIAKLDETTGEFRGYQPLFWIYFPNLRSELIRYDSFNRQNDIRLTYDALFSMRMFSSYIIKESNVYDRSINEYKMGMDALLEAENIKMKIFNFEQDVWEY